MRNRSVLSVFSLSLFLLASILAQPARAVDERTFRVGAMAGNVGLVGDPGGSSRNAIGYGAFASFFATEEINIEGSYLMSAHSGVKHSELGLGVNFYLSSYDVAYPYLSGGVSILTNDIDNPDVSGNAFGLYAGGGLDFELAKNVATGLQFRYQKAFEATTRVGTREVTTVGDSFSVMARLAFTFGGK